LHQQDKHLLLPEKRFFKKAVTHAEWFNWAEAADEFEAAEKLLTNEP
jgi:hypothetical protein